MSLLQGVAELVRRSTFQGVVVRAEHRSAWCEGDRRFRVTMANLGRAEGVALLAEIASQLALRADREHWDC